MSKITIFYKSVLGSAGKYSQWIQDETQCEKYTFNQAKKDIFEQHDVIIISSGTYMGQMPLTNFLKQNWKYMQGKIVIVVAVGMIPENHPDSIQSYEGIPGEIRNNIKYFKLPGKIFSRSTGVGVIKENIKPIIAEIRKYVSE